jgi:hypothetical protein
VLDKRWVPGTTTLPNNKSDSYYPIKAFYFHLHRKNEPIGKQARLTIAYQDFKIIIANRII